jgi:hypothetical protein
MDARSQRVTASDLDERRTWWLASTKCEGCGSYSEELEDGGPDLEEVRR